MINRVAVEERSTTAVVTAVNFDYRGFDTLGEEFILFAAVLVLALLLRRLREERRGPPADDPRRAHTTSAAVRLTCAGARRPDGAARDLLHDARAPDPRRRLPGRRDRGDRAVAGLPRQRLRDDAAAAPDGARRDREGGRRRRLRAIGLAGLVVAGASWRTSCRSATPGDLVSAGTIPLLSLAVGVEVAGGFVLLLSEFLDQLLVIRRSRDSGA